MKKSAFLSILTASLTLGAASGPQTTALDAWADRYLPALTEQARACVNGRFSWGELGTLAETASKAAQELKGIFGGTERAEIAQTILVVSVKAALPDNVEHWVLPMLEGDAVKALIESAFLKWFGAEQKGTPPVVDASELPKGGIE